MAVTDTDPVEALLGHVIVLDRMAHPHRVYHEHSLGPDKSVAEAREPTDLAKRTYKTLLRDAHHLGGDLFVEVAFACECGERLEQGPPVTAWASHVARACGLDAAVLGRHAVAHLRGGPATAMCACDRKFRAVVDPDDPAEALRKWAGHVAGLA